MTSVDTNNGILSKILVISDLSDYPNVEQIPESYDGF